MTENKYKNKCARMCLCLSLTILSSVVLMGWVALLEGIIFDNRGAEITLAELMLKIMAIGFPVSFGLFLAALKLEFGSIL